MQIYKILPLSYPVALKSVILAGNTVIRISILSFYLMKFAVVNMLPGLYKVEFKIKSLNSNANS